MSSIVQYTTLVWRAFGWKGIVRRAFYLFRLRSGALARDLRIAADFGAASALPWIHRFDVQELREEYVREDIVDQVREEVVGDADRVLSGQMQLYGDRWHEVAWPPRWHRNPFTCCEYPRAHWTKISDDDPERGDIKDVWELSRLAFTYLFARAYVLTNDSRYVEEWWKAVEDWAVHNPPNLGVNWRCGQEVSLRGIAICFGLSVFADHPATTKARSELAGRILASSVERVQATLGYALSQRNNHAISELTFLLTVRAGNERKQCRLLLEVLDDQFYADGSYSQQSFTYQRLALQTLQWLLLTRPGLSGGVRSRVVEALARSRDFLARCSDPVSGWLPNYGSNDGALLFHLSTAHYRDFRPLLASLGVTTPAAHREPAVWLPLSEVSERRSDAAERSTTYHTLRGPRSLALTRIGTGRHRPGHGDQQALDLWIDGRNVVVDPGTFRYTAPAPWRNALSGPDVHSVAHVPDEAVVSVGRFLRESMRAAELVKRGQHDGIEVLISRRPVRDGWLWRAVLRSEDAFAIVDASHGVDAVVRWNLGDATDVQPPWSEAQVLALQRTSDEHPTSGWSSPLYGSRRPLDVRLVPLPSGSVRCAKFTPERGSPITDTAVHEALSAILPPEDVAAFSRHEDDQGKF